MARVSSIVPKPRLLRPDESSNRLADAELLKRFFRHHEEPAFAELLSRHGPLVLGVCQRILGNTTDAEDAFQATFLVLVCKGSTLRQPEQLASWLYGVAHRTARKFKSKAALRTQRERQASKMATTCDLNDMTYQELRAILDEEISRLPRKYALPIVLCYLEGKTNAQAAAQLGWPEGSMSRRLARGRELLRSRLAKRGLALSAILMMSVFQKPAARIPLELEKATLAASRRVIEGEEVAEAATPTIAAVVLEVIGVVAEGSKLTAAAAIAAIVLAAIAIGWQLDATAYAASLFYRHKNPPGYVVAPDGTTHTLTTGGCGAPIVCESSTGCGTAPPTSPAP